MAQISPLDNYLGPIPIGLTEREHAAQTSAHGPNISPYLMGQTSAHGSSSLAFLSFCQKQVCDFV